MDIAPAKQEVFGRQHYFALRRIFDDGEPYLSVISNVFLGKEALDLYRLRFRCGIESLIWLLSQKLHTASGLFP